MPLGCPFIKVRHKIYNMTDIIIPYNLPDTTLFEGEEDGVMIWQPDRTYIILGQSNSPEGSLFVEEVIKDRIPVMKRPTGGEAVLLSPGMLVITVAQRSGTFIPSHIFFNKINGRIKTALKIFGLKEITSKGISDLAIGEGKILGSSMHRTENRLVYHAVLNVCGSTMLMEKYLRHPKREPVYRSGRSHSLFVTSLRNEGFKINYGQLIAILKTLFMTIEPSNNQIIQKSTLITA